MREDHGIAQLEALADGCRLVSTPATGPYPAYGLARELNPRYVGDALPEQLRAALDDSRAGGDRTTDGYAARARELLLPYRRASFDAAVRERVLPLLLAA